MAQEPRMSNEKITQDEQQEQGRQALLDTTDGLSNKKPEELTPEELRLMADTMPGEGPGD
jgi:hypothetical protein